MDLTTTREAAEAHVVASLDPLMMARRYRELVASTRASYGELASKVEGLASEKQSELEALRATEATLLNRVAALEQEKRDINAASFADRARCRALDETLMRREREAQEQDERLQTLLALIPNGDATIIFDQGVVKREGVGEDDDDDGVPRLRGRPHRVVAARFPKKTSHQQTRDANTQHVSSQKKDDKSACFSAVDFRSRVLKKPPPRTKAVVDAAREGSAATSPALFEKRSEEMSTLCCPTQNTSQVEELKAALAASVAALSAVRDDARRAVQAAENSSAERETTLARRLAAAEADVTMTTRSLVAERRKAVEATFELEASKAAFKESFDEITNATAATKVRLESEHAAARAALGAEIHAATRALRLERDRALVARDRARDELSAARLCARETKSRDAETIAKLKHALKQADARRRREIEGFAHDVQTLRSRLEALQSNADKARAFAPGTRARPFATQPVES